MDYSKYRLTIREELGVAGKSILGVAVVSWLFYNSIWGMICIPAVFLLLRKMTIQDRIHKRRQALAEQFMDTLKSVTAALNAGYSMENAWKEAQKETELLHGRDSLIYPEIAAMNRAIAMNVPMESTLNEFALRTGNEDIYEFAEVFRFAKRSGGDFIRIIETTVYRISGKYETQKEIAVLVAAKKMEQKVMNVVPVFILCYLKLTSAEYLQAVYGDPVGILFMTGCLGAYGAAIVLSKRILDIQV